MLADADLHQVASLMTGHRSTILLALLGGATLTATQLADRAGISPSLASSHLGRLLSGRLVAVEHLGRRRYYRLAEPHVAEVVESMLSLAPQRSARTLRESIRGEAIRHARTCYDHLAGELGVAMTDALQHHRFLQPADNSYRLTPSGEARLAELGIDVPALRTHRRTFARPCLDWTERRPHLAGSLGAALAKRVLELEWVMRLPNSRALRITDSGRRQLREQLAINIAS